MRLVDRPVKRPMHCAILPYIGQTHRGVRWADTGSELVGGFDNHVYATDLGTLALMEVFRFPTPGEYRTVRSERDAALERVRELETSLAEAQASLDAVHVLRRAGFEPARKPGRPKVEA